MFINNNTSINKNQFNNIIELDTINDLNTIIIIIKHISQWRHQKKHCYRSTEVN